MGLEQGRWINRISNPASLGPANLLDYLERRLSRLKALPCTSVTTTRANARGSRVP